MALAELQPLNIGRMDQEDEVQCKIYWDQVVFGVPTSCHDPKPDKKI